MARTTFFDDSPVLSVSELTHRLQQYVEKEYGDVCVEGEISGFKVSHSGHAYFTLKDEGAVLSCVIWRSAMARLKTPLEDGQMIRAEGGLTVYPPRGAYQLVVRKVDLAGEGLLLKRFEELKKKLASEGLFAPERKRPIPPLPQRIGVITSPTGAAIQDFLKVLGRFPGPEVDLFPVRVQGLEAAGEIAHALEVLGRWANHDVLVVTRGGGSLEDLWCFNEEAVARAIAASPIPVISAVGHEIDFTIADFVADLRVPTPTAAALHIVRNREDFSQKLDGLQATLIQHGIHRVERKKYSFESLRDTLLRLSPLSRIRIEGQKLDEQLGRIEMILSNSIRTARLKIELSVENLQRFPSRLIERRRERLASLGDRLKTLSPEATLQRGYSLTARADDGRILKTSEGLEPGERLCTRLYSGKILSKVIEANHDKA